MKLKISLFDNVASKLYDLSEVVTQATISTYLQYQPGRCELILVKTDSISFAEGSTVSVESDTEKIFKGFVFTISDNSDGTVRILALDQLRYLKSQDGKVFTGKTAAQIFQEISSLLVLKTAVKASVSHICTTRVEDGSSYYDMIQHAMDDTLIYAKQWLYLTDNFGILEMRDVKTSDSGVMIGDGSGMDSFSYQSSIDSDTYTQIKLYRDNQETGKRDIFIVNDTVLGGKNLKKWGILQLYQSVPESLNLKQIEAKGLGMLRLYDTPKYKLSLNSLGTFKVKAGTTLRVDIGNAAGRSIKQKMLVTECAHELTNYYHRMNIMLEQVE